MHLPRDESGTKVKRAYWSASIDLLQSVMMSSGTTATMSVFTLYFQYQKRTSYLLGAGLAGCGNDDANYGYGPLVGTLGDALGETVCPAVRMGISGKVRGMRAECPCPGGPPSRPPQPAQPPPVSVFNDSYLQADIRPLKQSQR